MFAILGFMNDDAILFLVLISYTTAGFMLFIYLYGKFLFKSLICIANETSILPQVDDQVEIPPTSIQYCLSLPSG
jgi:hypothetical protein